VTDREQYTPGPASGAQVRKDGEKRTLILVRELHHSPEKVWQALTDPAHLREWAPFEADGSLGRLGTTVKLTTVGAPTLHVSETTVTRADAPKLLEYNWGGFDMRWELEALGGGTRLTLWTNIGRRFISMGAAGWHICFDVLERLLAGQPIGRIRPRGDEVRRLAAAERGVRQAVRYRNAPAALSGGSKVVNRGGSHFVTLGEQDALAEGGYVVLPGLPDPLRARLQRRSH
jgi:uncharacterized protein YndB with AHSA1/START domain